jgi:hypothetical protein
VSVSTLHCMVPGCRWFLNVPPLPPTAGREAWGSDLHSVLTEEQGIQAVGGEGRHGMKHWQVSSAD